MFSRARHALWHGVRSVGLRPGDEVLTPAYHHGSEVEALLRAGLVCTFYEGNDKLEPDEAELESLLSPRVRALHLTHYLGLPQDAHRWRRWCDERGLTLIEDCAQAWLATLADGEPVGTFGDVSIFCVYKTLGVPDGGGLLAAATISRAPADGTRDLTRIARRHASWMVGRWPQFVGAAARLRRAPPYSAGDDMALGNPDSRPGTTLEFLLRRLVGSDVAAERRANYDLLLTELSEQVGPPFSDLPAGASPFAFPLITENKARTLSRLADAGITGLDFWSVAHPTLDRERFPRAAWLRTRVVGLPVHQETTHSDLERMVRTLRRTSARPAFGFEPIESFDAVRQEWSSLAEETQNIFSTWEWHALWWRHFGGERKLLTSVCRARDGRTIGFLPMYLATSHPLRIVRFVGQGQADHLGPLCRQEDRALVANAFRQSLRQQRFDLFIGDKVPASDDWSAFLGAKILRETGSPVLRFEHGTWDEFLASRSANFREQARRRERKLAREHDLRFRLSTDPAQLQADLGVLFRLHAARWKDGGHWFNETAEAFHRDFAARALERGWLRLWLLELDGQPVAAWYGFRFGGTESYYQAGRDPAWDRASVGFVLLTHSIRAALEDGMTEYRFLEGSEKYKYRFATQDQGLETLALPGSAAGTAALAAAVTVGTHPTIAALGRRLAG